MAKEDKEETNPWSRERTFWQKNAGDIVMLATSLFFLVLTIAAVGFLLIKPEVPGLSNIFKDPPPPPPRRQADQKFHYSLPGEAEVLIFPGKPVQFPPMSPTPAQPVQKPPAAPVPQQNR
jgi:hypothetical protein